MAMIRVTELDKIITDGLNNGLKKGGSWGKTGWDALREQHGGGYIPSCKLDILGELAV